MTARSSCYTCGDTATAPTVDDQFSAWSRIGHAADQPPSCEPCRAEKKRLRECDERRRAGR